MKKCYCGLNTVIKTSTTTNNRVRRFRGCLLFPRNGACEFFQWIDEKTIPFASNEQIWEDDILECRVREIELERELGAVKKHLNELEGDLSEAVEEISRLKGIIDGEMKKKKHVICSYYCAFIILLLCLCLFVLCVYKPETVRNGV